MKSDSISEFQAVTDDAIQKIVDYDQMLQTWILVTLSTLKDTSTETLAESWIATFNLTDVSVINNIIIFIYLLVNLYIYSLFNYLYFWFQILTEKAKTKEEKDCIVSERSKLRKIVEESAFKLDGCVRNSSEIGEPTRKNIQGAHQVILFSLIRLIIRLFVINQIETN